MSGTVHVELCEAEPEDKARTGREVGAWVNPTRSTDSSPEHAPFNAMRVRRLAAD